MRYALNLLLVSACAAPAFALSLDELGRDAGRDEIPRHHLRVSYGSLPKSAETTATVEGFATTTTTNDWEQAGRLAISYAYQGRSDGLVGFGLGLGFVSDRWSSTTGSFETSLSVNGLQVEPQLILRPARWFALELGLPLGAGAANLRTTSGSSVLAYNVDGIAGWYGAVVRPVFTIGSGFELFAEGGWLSSTASTEGQVVGLDVKVESTVAGSYAAFGIGLAF